MVSHTAYAGISIVIRVIILILALVSVILIFTAPGVCFTKYINDIQASNEFCPNDNYFFLMNVDHWRNGLHFRGRGQNVWGQLAIVILAILFALPPLAMSCLQMVTGNSLTYAQICVSLFSVIVFLVIGGVETWYATGFNHMGQLTRQYIGCGGLLTCDIVFVVKGWAAAAAFLFLCAVLFIVDMAIQLLRRDK